MSAKNKTEFVPNPPPRAKVVKKKGIKRPVRVVEPPIEPEVHAPDAIPGDPFLSQIAGSMGDNFIKVGPGRPPSYEELAQDHSVLKQNYDALAELTQALRAQFGAYVQSQMTAPLEFVLAIRHPASESVVMWWSLGSDPATICALGLQNPANFGPPQEAPDG